MFKRYLLASFVGGLTGACCVLIAVYVTNTKALTIDGTGLDSSVSVLHSRINDFYIFAGIVITLLLAINVGVFVRADEEVDRQIEESFGRHRKKLNDLLIVLEKGHEKQKQNKIRKERTIEFKTHDTTDEEFDSQL